MRFGVQFSPFNVIEVPPVQATPGDYRAGGYAVFSNVLTYKLGTGPAPRRAPEPSPASTTRVSRSSCLGHRAAKWPDHG
jgi:hypothetical protein